MVDIKLFYDKYLSCFDNIIQNIARNEGVDYRLLFSRAWILDFLQKGNLLSEKIYIDFNNDF